jgi:hypothetical protein
LLVGALGCGGDDPGPSQPAPSGAAGEGASGAAASGESGAGGSAGGEAGGGQGGGGQGGGGQGGGGQGGGAAAPAGAPRLVSVAKMAGNLHVFWALPDGASCDQIEGERKTDAVPYAVIFRVPGSTRDRHDGGAEADTTYTYRLRCSSGGAYSPYSDEMSGNPKGP